jgi:hypothetical protein
MILVPGPRCTLSERPKERASTVPERSSPDLADPMAPRWVAAAARRSLLDGGWLSLDATAAVVLKHREAESHVSVGIESGVLLACRCNAERSGRCMVFCARDQAVEEKALSSMQFKETSNSAGPYLETGLPIGQFRHCGSA